MRRRLRKAWGEYAKSKTAEGYEATMIACLREISPLLSAEHGARPLAKEVQAGRWLAAIDNELVTFCMESSVPGSRNADVRWMGERWEIKRIESANKAKVFSHLKRASQQSENVVIDLSVCMISDADVACEVRKGLSKLAIRKVLTLRRRRSKIFQKR